MDAKEVIGSISKVYDRFNIPPHLRMHMLRVASVSELICNRWNGPKINKDNIIAVMLLHDLGNIVKFRFEMGEMQKRIFGSESGRIEYWKKMKEETIKKYGSNEYEVTERMAAELNLNKELKSLMKSQKFPNIKKIILSDDYEPKICLYSDSRVGPFGVVSLAERGEDLKLRYGGLKIESMFASKDTEKSIFTLEKQVISKTDLRPGQINDESIKIYLKGCEKD